MSEALKLCPFCGGEMEYPYLNHPDVAKHPTHLRCFAAMAIVHPENADAWNTRTDLPATDEQAFANEKVKALVDALRKTVKALDEITDDDWMGEIDHHAVMLTLHEVRATLAETQDG